MHTATPRLRGIAFGGRHSIDRVELNFDGEKTWQQAELEPPHSPYSWVVWNFNWTPPKLGKHMIAVRAIDGAGQVQTSQLTRPQPSGATGLHTIVLDVRKA